jgi:hypothetical protein
MYEVFYATTRLARIVASDRETAKRSFAAYVLYDECGFNATKGQRASE